MNFYEMYNCKIKFGFFCSKTKLNDRLLGRDVLFSDLFMRGDNLHKLRYLQ